ncbi:MAG: hypothetical protein IJ499_04765 [Clostridia bacterium]|nr:hypothetical protein [Clostridia bacterium]
MAKILNNIPIIIKTLFSVSILQLMLISFYIIPPADVKNELYSLALYSYIPQMTGYAAMTSVLPIWILSVLKIKDKYSK